MNIFGKINKTMIISIGILTFFPQVASAYIDPGTGSYIFQVLIAVMVGGLFTIKLYWRKIKSLFKNMFSKERNDKREK